MTVQELIETLSKFDLQKEVVVDGYWQDYDYDCDDEIVLNYYSTQDSPKVATDGEKVIISLWGE